MTNSFIEVEYKESIEIGANFRIDAYRPTAEVDRAVYGEFLVSPTSASRASGYSEKWLGPILAGYKNRQKQLKALQALGFGGIQVNVKVVNHPTHRKAKPILLPDLPVVLQYASIYGDSVEQRTHASSLLLSGNAEYLKQRLRQAWGVSNPSEDQQRADFTQSYRHYREALSEVALTYPEIAERWLTTPSCDLKIAEPLSSYYHLVKRKIKSRYSNGVIPERRLNDIKKDVVYLASFDNDLKFVTRKDMQIEFGMGTINKCPELSMFLPMGSNMKQVLFMFEFAEVIIDHKFVEQVLGRRYLKFAKSALGIDKAFQIFVAPLGATPLAAQYINELTMDEEVGSVGVLTLNELVSVLRKRAYVGSGQGSRKGEINTVCSRLSYSIPETHNDFVLADPSLPHLFALNSMG